MRGITITDEDNAYLTVGVATPTAELGKELVTKGWFLPLNLNLSKSVLSSVTSGQSGLVTRCAGLLQEHVRTINYVDGLGNQQSAQGDDAQTLLTSLSSRGSTDVDTVICSIEFQCQKRNDGNAYNISCSQSGAFA